MGDKTEADVTRNRPRRKREHRGSERWHPVTGPAYNYGETKKPWGDMHATGPPFEPGDFSRKPEIPLSFEGSRVVYEASS